MYTHLHLHTEYSLLDGLCRIQPLMERAKELGMDSIAVTDHGALYSAIDFYSTARDFGIKPIIGCEAYIAPTDRHSRERADKTPHHLTILSKNEEGYNNLIQLITKAHLEGFYYKPRADKELLQEHHRGLIVLSGCPTAEIPRLIVNGQMDQALDAAKWYREVFDDFYLELQHHDLPMLVEINKGLVSIGSELGIPLVATNDVHYIHQDEAYIQDILLCIQTNATVHDEKRMKMPDDSLYLKSPREMEALFAEFPDAITNTMRIADACDLTLAFDRLRLPLYKTPNGEDVDQYLERMCREGLRKRFSDPGEDVERRLAYELDVIRSTQFVNYFLVVWDIIGYARENHILFGVRGSAAASLVLYCLGITDINPLDYRLVFERFLNLERKEMPDIDLDFQDDRRDEVIAYVTRKYGYDHVAQIVTFGTMGARGSLRDVGRALGMSYADVDRIARLIPFGAHSIADAMESTVELRSIYESEPAIQKLADTAQKLEGVARHASTHAAGVVISQEPLTRYVPLQRASKGDGQQMAVTQFAMEPIAKLGLLKMDFLGLVNLTILGKAIQIIAPTSGVEAALQNIPLNDETTFQHLSTGNTTGIFQLESTGMRRHIQKLRPNSLNDVSAMIALYRPGPMEHITTFIQAKHGKSKIRYPHPALKDILEETYGVIVYQDQVLLILQTFAGYSLGQADVVRKAMGKKIPSLMREERERFIEGGKGNGFSQELAQDVFDLIEPFAGYAFNKAHSISYAMIAYWTAYLKANYPAEFMTALLSCHLGQSDKVASAVAECHRLKIEVLPPDVNQSGLDFAIDKKDDGSQAIRFGLSAIKNVGAGAVKPILDARDKDGPFKSIEDLCRRIDLRSLNRRVLESLIKVGALDPLGNRVTILDGVEKILATSRMEWNLKGSGQSTMFDLWGDSTPPPLPTLELQDQKVSDKEKLLWEKELLGAYISESFISRARLGVSNGTTILCSEIDAEMENQRVLAVGQVSSFRLGTTKRGDPFGSAVLEDMSGSVEVVAWREVFERTKQLWVEGNILTVEGKVKVRNDRISIHCDLVQHYELPSEGAEDPESEPSPAEPFVMSEPATISPQTSEERPLEVWLKIQDAGNKDEDVQRLRSAMSLAQEYSGRDNLFLEIREGQRKLRMEMPGLRVGYCPELHERLASLLGEDGVVVEKDR